MEKIDDKHCFTKEELKAIEDTLKSELDFNIEFAITLQLKIREISKKHGKKSE